MKEKQNLLVRACGLVTMMYVINWNNYQSYFEVRCRDYFERYENACAAEDCFERMCKQEEIRENDK